MRSLPKAWILAELAASDDAAGREVIERVSALGDSSGLPAVREALSAGDLSEEARALAAQIIAKFESSLGQSETDAEPAVGFELDRAVRDARLVLSYAMTEGIELEHELVSQLVEFCGLIEAGNHTKDTETQFWLASGRLHNTVAPITAGRIRQYRGKKIPAFFARFFSRKPLQATGNSTWLYAILLAIAIVLTLVGHLYFHVLEHSTVAVRTDLERLALLQNAVKPADAGAEVVVKLTDGSVFLREDYSAARECDLKTRWSSELAVADRLMSRPWTVFRSTDGESSCVCNCAGQVLKATSWDDVSLPDPDSTLTRSLSIQKLMLFPLLPFLYATMGTLIFILRAISGEISKLDYSRARQTQYLLRLPMGMVAGVTIGYLFTPDTLTGLASLTPLGVAFVAGYSVELLFNIIDRIIGAFVDNSKGSVAPDKSLKPPQ